MRTEVFRKNRTQVTTLLLAGLGFSCGNLSGPNQPEKPGACTANGQPLDAAVRQPKLDAAIAYDGDGGIVSRKRAILVSVDGLGAYYVRDQLAAGKLPNFAKLQQAGAATLNARADYEHTVTLPNHTSMLTGRPVSEDEALPNTTYHGWTINGTVPSSTTLHNSGNPNLTYIASVFDVVHDHGFSTCLYSGKPKFAVFANSYNTKNGAPDEVDEDDGCNKVDRVSIVEDTETLIGMAEGDLGGGVCDFAFIHIADPDRQGHSIGWGSETWLATLDQVDDWIGRIAAFADPKKTDHPFFLVVTADHGGFETQHADKTLPLDYTIPFYVVGAGIPANTDLYSLAGPDRADPGNARIRFSAPRQPVRNADAANTITWLLGLPPVPGSFMRDLLK
jgi:hypothetical protein